MSELLTLTNPQKRQLKALAHHRKPVVLIGIHGITPTVLSEIEQALTHHELLKIRISTEDRDSREAILSTICAQTGAVRVQRVGNIATLFRRNPTAPRVVFS